MHWTCTVCGADHDGLPLDYVFNAPAYWDGGRSEEDFLASDLCVWTGDDGTRNYFIRGVLHLPIVGSEETLRYGVWSSLSRRSFERVRELWDDVRRIDEPPYFGWLSNSLEGYPETLNLPVDVITDELALRPSIVLREGEHPLVAEQVHGVAWDRVHSLAERTLHATR